MTITYETNLSQYVAELTVGTRKVASLLGTREPSPEERQRVENRLRAMASKPRVNRNNYVPANAVDPEAYMQAWES